MKFPSLSHIGESLQQVIKRYPLCVLVAITATISALIILELSQHTGNIPFVAKLLACCGLAMPLFFSVHSLFEQNKKKESGILLILGLALIGIFYFNIADISEKLTEIAFYRFLSWNFAFHLIAAFSTFFLPQEINGFWQWNKSLFLRFLLATLYAVVLFIGLAGAILAVKELFHADIDGKNFGRVWILIALFFQPIFFLSGIPSPIADLQQDNFYPKGLKIFTQYVLLPLVMVYMLILYAYMGKIMLDGEFPNGWVCYLILGFSITGILALLLLHPLIDDEENKWIKWAHRAYFILILPLVALMLVSINIRLQAYGLTPNRYIIVLLAIWLGSVGIYFTFFKQRNIILIPMSLAVLALFAVIGPWGMFSMSVRSQLHRIEPLLSKYSLLKEGKFQSLPKDSNLAEKDRRIIASGLESLLKWEGQTSVAAWIPNTWQQDSIFDKNGEINRGILADKLGISLSTYSPYEADTSAVDYSRLIRVNSEASLMKGIEVQGFRKIGELQACHNDIGEGEYCNTDNFLVQGKIQHNKVFITGDSLRMDSLDLQILVEKIATKYNWNEDYITYENSQDLVIAKEGAFKFMPSFILVKKTKAKTEVRELRGILLYK